MSDKPSTDFQAKAQFWRERAEGYERRINSLIAEVNTQLNPPSPATTLEECLEVLAAVAANAGRQLDVMRAYLWATIACHSGRVVIVDELLQRALTGELKISAANGTQTVIEAMLPAPETIELPRIILPP
ncbi:MAG TPA: hypothetical protein VGF13_17185 [Verrucomicrobiae bacterium]